MTRRKPRLTTRIEDLAAALRAHAEGSYRAEAAVELLIGHQWWLYRDDFVVRFASVQTDPTLVGQTPMALIGWAEAIAALDAGQLPCSRGEAAVLRIAASIDEGVPVGLGAVLTGLDATTMRLVAQAVAHAGGRRQAIAVTGEVAS